MDTDRQVRELAAQLMNIMRLGEVSAVYPERATVRVRLADARSVADGAETPLVSAELPVLHHRAHGDRAYWLPDVGERVLCLFLPYGREAGVVLGSLYSGADAPPVASRDKAHLAWKDGTWIEYDRAAHRLAVSVRGDVDLVADGDLTAQVQGDVALEAGGDLSASVQGAASVAAVGTLTLEGAAGIVLRGPSIAMQGVGGACAASIQADLSVQGDVSLTGDLEQTGNQDVTGDVTASGAIMDGAGNSNHHTHDEA